MYLTHDPSKAANIARRAITAIEDLGMSPHPDNFILWYNYFSGDCPSLAPALDKLIESNSFSDMEGARLRSEFIQIPLDGNKVEELAHKLQSQMTAVLSLIEEARNGTANYGAILENADDQFSRQPDNGHLIKVISRLISDTCSALEHTKSVARHLEINAKEVSQLKSELAATQRDATIDPLTGLLNRRQFEIMLRDSIADSIENDTNVSLIFADIDHFKSFNDRFGHAIGDQVLKLVAKIIKDNVRGRDIPTRYGGEEFTVILPNTRLDGAEVVAETIRRTLSARSLMNKKTNEIIGSVTVSIGVAQYGRSETLAAFVERADDALYRAKQLGRNRVIAGTAPSPDQR
jgi:diguanylate cyclase